MRDAEKEIQLFAVAAMKIIVHVVDSLTDQAPDNEVG
jgi:hypothetical protein